MGVSNEEERIAACCEEFRHKLDAINHHRYTELTNHINKAVSNVVANTRWRFLAADGPRIGTVTNREPIMWK